jgi:hypothetical protein
MFELKNMKPNTDASGYRGAIMYNGRRVCCIDTWGFASCGVLNLFNFGYPDIKKGEEKAFADKFFKFLETVNDPHWKPNEAYMFWTDGQLKADWINALAKHPEIKRRDKFFNKSHGPNNLHLFRWSKAKDFKRVTKYA